MLDRFPLSPPAWWCCLKTAWSVPCRLLQLEQPSKMLDIEHLVLAHTHTCTDAHTGAHTHAHTHACMHACTYAITHSRMHTHTHARTQAGRHRGTHSLHSRTQARTLTCMEGPKGQNYSSLQTCIHYPSNYLFIIFVKYNFNFHLRLLYFIML